MNQVARFFQTPTIEYGFPIPPKRIKRDLRRTPRPSPWIEFLKDIPPSPGRADHMTASFLVEYARLQALRNVAAKLGIELEIQDSKKNNSNGLRLARVWRRS